MKVKRKIIKLNYITVDKHIAQKLEKLVINEISQEVFSKYLLQSQFSIKVTISILK